MICLICNAKVTIAEYNVERGICEYCEKPNGYFLTVEECPNCLDAMDDMEIASCKVCDGQGFIEY